MTSHVKYVVEVENRRQAGETLMRVVETPFGEYKAALVAVLDIREKNPDFHYAKITVRKWVRGDLDDPNRSVVDPWAAWAPPTE